MIATEYREGCSETFTQSERRARVLAAFRRHKNAGTKELAAICGENHQYISLVLRRNELSTKGRKGAKPAPKTVHGIVRAPHGL